MSDFSMSSIFPSTRSSVIHFWISVALSAIEAYFAMMSSLPDWFIAFYILSAAMFDSFFELGISHLINFFILLPYFTLFYTIGATVFVTA